MPMLPSCNMLKNEMIAFLAELKDDMRVFEWGSGQSTIFFSQWCKEYVSIEDNEEWMSGVSKALVTKNVQLFLLPDMVEYVQAVEPGYDIYFVDGQVRVECARRAATVMRPRDRLFFHDWDREEYHGVLDTFNVERVVDTLAMLRLR